MDHDTLQKKEKKKEEKKPGKDKVKK